MALELIIPPQHQSAPKEPARAITPFEANSPEAGSFEQEMAGGPALVSNDPREQALIRGMQQQAAKQEKLNVIEEALRQHEKSLADERTKRQQWAGQERWQGKENEEMRLVHIMHAHTFIDKLQRAGLDAVRDDPFEYFRDHAPCNVCGHRRAVHTKLNDIERMLLVAQNGKAPCDSWQPDWRGQRPNALVWLNSFSVAGRVGVNAWVKGEPKTVTTLQYPYSPEYSIMRFNEWNVPTAEKYRGWRTALLTLIVSEVLTEEEAERAFGPALGPAGAFYREQLFNHRSLRYGLRA